MFTSLNGKEEIYTECVIEALPLHEGLEQS